MKEMVWAETPSEFDAFASRNESVISSRSVLTSHAEALPREAIERLHSFLQRHSTGGPVLLKTSTTGDRPLSHEVSAELLASVVSVTLQHVTADRVKLADGPVYATYLDECVRAGWADICRQHNIQILDLNFTNTVLIDQWPVASDFVNASAIINLTRAKTHRRSGVSLGLKSLVGVLSGQELGFPKLAGRHRLLPQLLLALELACPPVFTIIDGREGIEGEGPMNGQTTASQFMVFGDGLIGPDIRAAVEMGFDPALVPGFFRPWTRELAPVAESLELPWAKHRIDRIDYLPALSCSWLYRSLSKTTQRTRRYRHLLSGVRACWT
jgi:uncharacterized protein (DUF362 family)